MNTEHSLSRSGESTVLLLSELREFHGILPLAGNPQNALLSLPDDLLTYLIAAIRNTPCPPPGRSMDDWQQLLTLLRPHGIFPLIAYHLRSWPEECRPPQEIMEFLNRIFLAGAARNLLAGHQIQTVVSALKKAGIPVIVLKGHALARSVYPDPALRQSCDIDLLVQPKNIPAAETVLESLGYLCPFKSFHQMPAEEHHEAFSLPAKGLLIELHWVTDRAFRIFPEGWLDAAFSRRISVSSADLTFDTFCHADHLLFLIFHDIFQHRSLRLDWICDISRIMGEIKTPDEWHELASKSVDHHIRISLERGINAAGLWTGSRLPAGTDDLTSWPSPSRREISLIPYAETRGTHVSSGLLLTLQAQPGISGKIMVLTRFVFPPVYRMKKIRKSASRADIPAAYVRRWLRIFRYI